MQYPDELQDAPPSGRNFHVKASGIATVIASIAALVASVTALVKATDTSLSKRSYEALAQNIRQLSDDGSKNRDAMEAMHKYLEEDRDSRLAAASAAASVNSPPALPPLAPTHKPPTVKKTQPVVPPAPPDIGERPPGATPLDFNAVLEQGK